MQRLIVVYEEVVLNKKCRSRGLEVVEGAGPVGPVPRRAACRFRRRGPARSVVVSTLGTRSAVTSPAAPAQGPPAPYYCTSFGTLWTRREQIGWCFLIHCNLLKPTAPERPYLRFLLTHTRTSRLSSAYWLQAYLFSSTTDPRPVGAWLIYSCPD